MQNPRENKMKIKLSELRRVIREVVQESVDIQEVGRLDVGDVYMSAVPASSASKGAVMVASDTMKVQAFLDALDQTLQADLGPSTEAVNLLNTHLKGVSNVLTPADLNAIADAYNVGDPSETLKGSGFEHDLDAHALLDAWSNKTSKMAPEEKKPLPEKPAVSKLHAAMASKGIKPRY
jgi:hypothetical protein